MVFNKNKRGQAAIEFLMTYGWMLLVVLIVGALIFSFVDFSGLLPSQLELNNNLRGDPNQLNAYGGNPSYIQFAGSYIGTRSALINASGIRVTTDLGTQCNSSKGTIEVNNADTTDDGASGTGDEVISIINGQYFTVTINCNADALTSGDVLEGEIVIPVTNSRTRLETRSSGSIRVAIQ